jgi:hypothetical protein
VVLKVYDDREARQVTFQPAISSNAPSWRRLVRRRAPEFAHGAGTAPQASPEFGFLSSELMLKGGGESRVQVRRRSELSVHCALNYADESTRI